MKKRASRAHQEPQETVIRTARSTGSHGSFGTDTEAGSILGTPAYMPPEQASGDIAHLDRRADVFGLGAILCEILTGKPPYLGRSSEEVRRKAANGDLADATARLDGCGADAELIALTRKCLSPEADRPAEGCPGGGRRAVGLPGRRSGATPGSRTRASRGRGEGRRGASAAPRSARAGGVSAGIHRPGRPEHDLFPPATGRAGPAAVEQAAAVDRVVGQAVTLRDQAKENPEDVTRWQVALAAVKQAEAAGDEAAAPRLLALREEIQAGLDAAQRDKTLLDRLVDIRSAEADDQDGSISDRDYADAFREAGIDVARLSPAEAGARIKARPPSVATALASALDDWASVRRDKRKNAAGAASLSQAAQIADPDPWRTDLRNALDEPDKAARLTRLQAVEKKANYDALGPISLHLLGSGLINADDPALAESVSAQGPGAAPAGRLDQLRAGAGRWRNSRAATRRSASTPPRAPSGPRPPTSWPMPWRSGAIATRPSPCSAISADYVPAMRDISVAWAWRSRRLAGRARPRRRSKPPSSRDVRRSGTKPGSASAHRRPGQSAEGQRPGGRGHRLYRKAIELDPKSAGARTSTWALR